jgi:hypothetical protein
VSTCLRPLATRGSRSWLSDFTRATTSGRLRRHRDRPSAIVLARTPKVVGKGRLMPIQVADRFHLSANAYAGTGCVPARVGLPPPASKRTVGSFCSSPLHFAYPAARARRSTRSQFSKNVSPAQWRCSWATRGSTENPDSAAGTPTLARTTSARASAALKAGSDDDRLTAKVVERARSRFGGQHIPIADQGTAAVTKNVVEAIDVGRGRPDNHRVLQDLARCELCCPMSARGVATQNKGVVRDLSVVRHERRDAVQCQWPIGVERRRP